jgi:hypothetical protein
VYTRVGIAVLAILALGSQPATPQARNSFNGFALVDKSGNIKKPADYRDLYQTLGTYFVLDPKGGNQMHLTYASPGAADYYRRNKKFADGTVLVKEVFGTDHPAYLINGMKSNAAAVRGVEVLSIDRFVLRRRDIQAVLVGFAAFTDAEIRKAVIALAQAFEK